MKSNNITGVFLDADLERMLRIELPLIETVETVTFENKKLSTDSFKLGEFAFLGDFHYGNSCFSKSVVYGYLEYLKEHPNILIGLMGDIIEYGEGQKYIREDERVPIDDQIANFVSDFHPFRDRIKFLLWGNHEERYVRKSQSKNLMRYIALELGINPDEGNCYIAEPQRGLFITFLVEDNIYGAYVQHSKTQARINQDLQLRRAGSQNIVSLIAHGHTHRLTWKPRTFRVLEMIDNRLVNSVRRQYLLATGCALKYPPYAEAGSFPYTEVGFPIVRFYADHNEMDCYDLTNRYRAYLEKGSLFHPDDVELSSLIDKVLVTVKCPKCNSEDYQKRGTSRIRDGIKQRYQCKACGKWFSATVED